jgi:hypothetical protein
MAEKKGFFGILADGWVGGIIALVVLFLSINLRQILTSTIGVFIKGNIFEIIFYTTIYFIGAFIYSKAKS